MLRVLSMCRKHIVACSIMAIWYACFWWLLRTMMRFCDRMAFSVMANVHINIVQDFICIIRAHRATMDTLCLPLSGYIVNERIEWRVGLGL